MAAGHGRRMQWRVTQRRPSASEVESLRSELSTTDIARSDASLAAKYDVCGRYAPGFTRGNRAPVARTGAGTMSLRRPHCADGGANVKIGAMIRFGREL
jgi:hypothetical protein